MIATTTASLLGGIGLFLLGMWLMTDGLKVAAGNTLKSILDQWTNSALRGFFAGVLITSLVQSSSAVTVATVGFVNAGLLSLAQAVWVIIGTNVGTTMTGWLVALIGIKVDINAMALPLLGIGMLIRLLAGEHVRRAGLGQALAGFGAFFLGISILQGAFANLSPAFASLKLDSYTWMTTFAFVGIGFALTVLTQSSSAAIAITLTASATGSIPLTLAAAVVVGTNIGTTSTAVFAALTATPAAKRVATAHIAFNLMTGIVALALLSPLLTFSVKVSALISHDNDIPATLAVFHTIFNLLGAGLVWPIRERLIAFLKGLFISKAEQIAQPTYLDDTLISVPALAVRGLILELNQMIKIAFEALRRLIEHQGGSTAAILEEQDGLSLIGQKVRSFIGRLSSGSLPEDVVNTLPDLIRVTQHLDDLTISSRRLSVSQTVRRLAYGPLWDQLRNAVHSCVALLEATDPPRLSPDRITDLSRAVENAYQELKADLLYGAAVGKTSVDHLDQALDYARALRYCATITLKVMRRFAPLLARIDTEALSKKSNGTP